MQSLLVSGSFDLAHVKQVAQAVEKVEEGLSRCRSIEIDLVHLERIDGTGAILLARLFDRLDVEGRKTRVVYQLLYDGEEPLKLPNLVKGKTSDENAWGSSGKNARYLSKLGRYLGKFEERDRKLILLMAQKMAFR